MSELNAYVCCVCVQEKLENRVRMLEKEVNDAAACRMELFTVAEMQKFTLVTYACASLLFVSTGHSEQ